MRYGPEDSIWSYLLKGGEVLGELAEPWVVLFRVDHLVNIVVVLRLWWGLLEKHGLGKHDKT